MKIPAAMARIARTTPRPLIIGINIARPVRISQMANKSIPMFLVNLTLLIKSILS
jgi:hypothetical protein